MSQLENLMSNEMFYHKFILWIEKQTEVVLSDQFASFIIKDIIETVRGTIEHTGEQPSITIKDYHQKISDLVIMNLTQAVKSATAFNSADLIIYRGSILDNPDENILANIQNALLILKIKKQMNTLEYEFK